MLIALAPHPVFRPVHLDLYFDLALTPWEAALRADVEVPVALSERERELFLELSRISVFNPRTVAPEGEKHEATTN